MLGSLLRRFILVVLVLVPIVSACGDDEKGAPSSNAPPGSELKYEAGPLTRELTASTLADIVDLGPMDGTVRFKGSPPQLAGLAPGEILLAGGSTTTPHGLLRFVTEVTNDAGGTAVKTKVAPLQAAFKTLHVRTTTSDTSLDGAPGPGSITPKGVHQKVTKYPSGTSIELNPFDQDGDPSTKDDQLYVKGSAEGHLTITAWVDLDWLDSPAAIKDQIKCAFEFPFCTPSLPNVVIGARADIAASVGVDAEGAASRAFKTDVLKLEGSDITLPSIWIGPVELVPSIDFTTQVEGTAAARFHSALSLKYENSIEASVGTLSGPNLKPPSATLPEFTSPIVDVSLSSNVKVSIGPRLNLMFWDSFGPNIGLMGFAKLHADMEKTPCWGVDGGLDLVLGIRFRIPWERFDAKEIGWALGLDGDLFSTSTKKELFKVENLATGACGTLPTNIYPPGDGPSDDVYRAPTFAPWSNRYSNMDTTFPVSGEVTEQNIHTDKMVDGAWLVTGKGLPGVMKISEAGDVRWVKRIRTLVEGDEDLVDDKAKSAIAAQALDTKIWVATSRFNVMKLDTDGDLVWAKRFRPEDLDLRDALDATSLIALPDGGALVQYGIENTPKDGPAVLLRLDANGKLLWSKTYKYETEKTYAPILVLDGEEVIMSGYSWSSGEHKAHVARIRLDGSVIWSRQLDVCASSYVRPSAAVLLASKAIAITGTTAAAPQQGFLTQISPDGERATNATWWTGSSVKDDQVNGVAQLPVTGFVTAGIGVGVKTYSLLLAHHDGQGVVTAQSEYEMKDSTGPWSIRPGAIRMTNDGGALVFAHVQPDLENTSLDRPGLWISKLPARTLQGPFDASRVQPLIQEAIGVACEAKLKPDTLALTDLPFTTVDAMKLTVIDARQPTVEKMIP